MPSPPLADAPSKPPASPVPRAEPEADIQTLFNLHPGPDLRHALAGDKPLFLYVPWIPSHANQLLESLRTDRFSIAPLDHIPGSSDPKIRRQVARYIAQNPDVYRRVVIARLLPIKNRIAGLIFTLDWNPVMRLVAGVCEDLGIPRILIPHESVLAAESLYYVDSVTQASVPVADHVLAWGALQKRVFVERGYDAARIETVGTPKLDPCAEYRPICTRQEFHRVYGLDPDRKTIVFALQPLDPESGPAARDSQRAVLSDLLKLVSEEGHQLLVRTPLSGVDLLGPKLRNVLQNRTHAALDDASCRLTPAEEAVFHADLLVSGDSILLLEALLVGRPSLAAAYTGGGSLWRALGIPGAPDAETLRRTVQDLLSRPFTPSPTGLQWAAEQFSGGRFDGGATARIIDRLARIAETGLPHGPRPTALERVLNGTPVDVVSIPSAERDLATSQKYLQAMIQARTLLRTGHARSHAAVDVFLQWGVKPGPHKASQAARARRLSRPVLIVEDAFVRSRGIGLSGEPGLGILLDDLTAHYDATRPSRLETLLEDRGAVLSPAQRLRARTLIQSIRRNRISKYNHAPDMPLVLGGQGRKKLLLVDQRYGDQSILSGLASEESFDQMLADALAEFPDWDIIVKQHPDAITGGKESYFSNDRLAGVRDHENVYVISHDINPHALFDAVDRVHVATSGFGFEALMAGLPVRCYGAPFYSGWGLTEDRQPVARRTNRRSLEEIFHFSYVHLSRYYSPTLGRRCELEDVIAHLVQTQDTAAPGMAFDVTPSEPCDRVAQPVLAGRVS